MEEGQVDMSKCFCVKDKIAGKAHDFYAICPKCGYQMMVRQIFGQLGILPVVVKGKCNNKNCGYSFR